MASTEWTRHIQWRHYGDIFTGDIILWRQNGDIMTNAPFPDV